MDTDKVLNVYANFSEYERINLVRGLVAEIAICSAEIRSLLDSLVECYKLQHLTPSQIEGILSGQITMIIEPKQYPCGVYDVLKEDKVICQIEVEKVEKIDMSYFLFTPLQHAFDNKYKEMLNALIPYVCKSGFETVGIFEQYHRENYAPIKYAMTFKLIK